MVFQSRLGAGLHAVPQGREELHRAGRDRPEQEVAGQTVTVQQYSTQANGSSAVSQGVEVYAQHTLDFGLGAQVNFTYNDTSQADVTLNGTKLGESALVGSAKTQLNASVFYEHGPVLLRASYNRRGEVVRGLASGLNVYDDPYDQIDLNAALDVFRELPDHRLDHQPDQVGTARASGQRHEGPFHLERLFGPPRLSRPVVQVLTRIRRTFEAPNSPRRWSVPPGPPPPL
jgi:hypothetical protein